MRSSSGYEQVAVIFPFVVAAPRYFSGQIQLGGLTQTAGAFGQVQGALSWFVSAYATLAQWRAIVERLTTFHRAIVLAARRGRPASRRAAPAEPTVAADGRSRCGVRRPDARAAATATHRCSSTPTSTFEPGASVVVTGRSGSGKSTLFRALAGHLAVRPAAGWRARRRSAACSCRSGPTSRSARCATWSPTRMRAGGA